MKNKLTRSLGFLGLALSLSSSAFATDAAQDAIVAAGATVAGYAGAAAAAGVAIMVVIFGVRAAKRGLKSAS